MNLHLSLNDLGSKINRGRNKDHQLFLPLEVLNLLLWNIEIKNCKRLSVDTLLVRKFYFCRDSCLKENFALKRIACVIRLVQTNIVLSRFILKSDFHQDFLCAFSMRVICKLDGCLKIKCSADVPIHLDKLALTPLLHYFRGERKAPVTNE